MMKKIIIVLILTLLTSCSFKMFKDVHDIKPGDSTVSDAIDILGEPNSVTISSFDSNVEVFEYDEFSIQIEKKLVKAIFFIPMEEEISLQHWKHLHSQEVSTWSAVRAPASVGLWELKYPEIGFAIIYDQNTSKVVRMIKYEP